MGDYFIGGGFAPDGETVELAPEPGSRNRQGGKPWAKLGFHVLGGLGELIDLVGVRKIHRSTQIFYSMREMDLEFQ